MSKRNRRSFSQPVSHAVPKAHTLEGADHRQVRLEHLLFDELQTLLRDEASDPALTGITLLHLELSNDGGHARIGYAVAAPLHAETQAAGTSRAALTRALGFLRTRLAQRLDLKRTPKLTFTFVGVSEPGGEP